MLLTNKHVITAMIVAPILAIITYYAVDFTVSEKPNVAEAGKEYPLVAKSNCRYESNICTLTNGDIEINITPISSDSTHLELEASSELAIQGIKIALAPVGSDSRLEPTAPSSMEPSNYQQTKWQVKLEKSESKEAKLLIVVSLNDSLYFGETLTTFIK